MISIFYTLAGFVIQGCSGSVRETLATGILHRITKCSRKISESRPITNIGPFFTVCKTHQLSEFRNALLTAILFASFAALRENFS
jgi:hypothetical protein